MNPRPIFIKVINGNAVTVTGYDGQDDDEVFVANEKDSILFCFQVFNSGEEEETIKDMSGLVSCIVRITDSYNPNTAKEYSYQNAFNEGYAPGNLSSDPVGNEDLGNGLLTAFISLNDADLAADLYDSSNDNDYLDTVVTVRVDEGDGAYTLCQFTLRVYGNPNPGDSGDPTPSSPTYVQMTELLGLSAIHKEATVDVTATGVTNLYALPSGKTWNTLSIMAEVLSCSWDGSTHFTWQAGKVGDTDYLFGPVTSETEADGDVDEASGPFAIVPIGSTLAVEITQAYSGSSCSVRFTIVGCLQ